MTKNYFYIALLIPLLALPCEAASSSNKEIKFKSRDLEKVQEEMNRKKEEKQRLIREAEDLSNAVKETEQKIRSTQEALVYTKRKNSEVLQEMAVTKNKHDHVISQIEQQNKQYTEAVTRYYVTSVLYGSQNLTTVAGRQALHMRAVEIRGLRGQKEEVNSELNSLVESQKAIRSEVLRQESKLSDMRSGVENKEQLLTKKMTRQEILDHELRELEKTAQELASLIDVLRSKAREEKEAEKQARIQKQVSGQSPIMLASLPWPITGKVLTKYGRQTNSSGSTYISNGIIIGGAEDQPVSAVSDGTVLYAGQFMSYGAMTVLEHPGDWYTVYGHLARWDVEKGQEVKKGDTIGLARPRAGGGTETYFELRFYGKPTDPMPWLSH